MAVGTRATLAQLKQLGLDSYALSQMTDADLTAALNAAKARVDAALSMQYTLPILDPYPFDLIECECVLASWTALMVRGYNPATGIDTNIKERYEEWRSYLDKVSKGELQPVITDSSTEGDPGPTGVAVYTATQRGYSERGISPCTFPVPQTDPFSGD